MYKSGLLKCLDPPCSSMDSDGICDEWSHRHNMVDSREKKDGKRFSFRSFIAPEVCYYLPHSCDEWVIGGEKEIVTLIEDLQAALLDI